MILKNKKIIYSILLYFLLSIFQESLAQSLTKKGMLVVYWGNSLDYKVKNKKILYFDFFPEDNVIASKNKISLKLNKYQQQIILKELITPKNFYLYQEESIKQPAQITMENLNEEVICDRKYYSAKFIKFEKIKKTIAKPRQINYGCIDEIIKSNHFVVKSTDGLKVNLREQPSINSLIVRQLDDGTVVEKLRTFHKDWYFVEFKKSDHENFVRGYIHKSQLQQLE